LLTTNFSCEELVQSKIEFIKFVVEQFLRKKIYRELLSRGLTLNKKKKGDVTKVVGNTVDFIKKLVNVTPDGHRGANV
jgi:hypothetical protein